MSVNQVNVPNPNNPAACCPCAQQVECSCGVACVLSCAARAGFATYCGFPEFVPSNPPNFYHSKSLSGTITVQTYIINPCTDAGPSQVLGYSGSSTIDEVTCVKTIGGVFSSTGTVCGTVIETQEDITSGFGSFCTGCPCGQGASESATVVSVSATPGCTSCGAGFETAFCQGGPWQEVLSIRDTEEMAVARATVGVPYKGSDCAANFSYTTTVLPNQTEFAFQDAQVQVTLPTPKAGGMYQVTVTLLERATGSGGALVPYGSLIFDLTAPPSGPAISAYQQLPLVQGYEIHATGCSVVELS